MINVVKMKERSFSYGKFNMEIFVRDESMTVVQSVRRHPIVTNSNVFTKIALITGIIHLYVIIDLLKE